MKPVINYAGRQVDIELLQSIQVPSGTQQVHVTNVRGPTRIVAGIEKALQRYTVILLSTPGDNQLVPTMGTTLLSELNSGRISDNGSLARSFAAANSSALGQLAAADADPQYGSIPDDERIVDAVLDDFSIDYSAGTVYLTIVFTTAAGSDIEFVVPVATART